MLNCPELTLNNGVKIPQLGLGVYRSENDETAQSVAWAIEAGYRHIDTATAYKNEEGVAAGIKASGIKREELFITTKLSSPYIKEMKAFQGIDESLERLQTDYVDLYLIHWAMTNYEKAWEDLIKIYEQKKARAIGVCNCQLHHLKKLESLGLPVQPAVNQIELHPTFQQKDVMPYSKEHGMVVEDWAPLGGVDNNQVNNPVIQAIAQKHGKTGAQVIIRWHIQLGNVVIPKSSKKERIIENSQVFDFELDAQDMAQIAALDTNTRTYWDPDRYLNK